MEQTVSPKLALSITRFAPKPVEHGVTVGDVRQLREALAPFAGEPRLALSAEIAGGREGMLILHLTGDRAWVTHFESDEGGDTYALDPTWPGGPIEGIGFRLSNGQEDTVHRRWTVSRAEAMQALEEFAVSGERPRSLAWDDAIELL
jgi:hypothetical protein